MRKPSLLVLLAIAACSSSVVDATQGSSGSAEGATAASSASSSTAVASADAVSSSNASASSSSATGTGGGAGGCALPPSCTMAQEAEAWASMDAAKILPGSAANLELVGSNKQPITLASAQKINCQPPWPSVVLLLDGCVADGLTLFPGYTGTFSFKSADAQAAYAIAVSSPITKNGQPFTLDAGWSGPGIAVEIDELYRAVLSTYAPNAPLDPLGTTCVDSKKCQVGLFGPTGYFYFPLVGLSFWVDDVTMPQPAPSTPSRIDVYPPL